jgi:signal transduction histidine kinase
MGLSEIVFESLLNSLLDNARRCGATSIDISIATRRLDASQEVLKVEFKDDGPGVPESDRQRIFDEGFTTKTEAEGDGGLGLFNVRSLLAIHGGSIDLLDTPSGATFVIEIPLKP